MQKQDVQSIALGENFPNTYETAMIISAPSTLFILLTSVSSTSSCVQLFPLKRITDKQPSSRGAAGYKGEAAVKQQISLFDNVLYQISLTKI